MPNRVLIVDDTKGIRDVVGIVAAAAGLEVCASADNGHAAVELARQYRPDAVVLDQEMPVLDGISALPLILHAAPGATVVMFSSSDDAALVEAALARGAAAYFRKGVDTVDDVVAYLCDRLEGS